MKKNNTMRVKREAIQDPVPQSKEEVIAAIAEIGRLQRERARIEAEMNDRLAEIRQVYEEEAAPYAERIKALSLGVQTWCEAHREELTQGGKIKTVRFASGEVRWRTRPPSVLIRSTEAVIDTLKKLGLTRFIRLKEEVNKEAILAEPDAIAHIKGITISQKEDLVILPFETTLEEVI